MYFETSALSVTIRLSINSLLLIIGLNLTLLKFEQNRFNLTFQILKLNIIGYGVDDWRYNSIIIKGFDS
jgi:hypothetical protein